MQAAKFKPLYEELVAAAKEPRCLPNEALNDLVYLINDKQQAQQFISLVATETQKRVTRPDKDWPYRKKLYNMFAGRALEVGASQILVELLRKAETSALEKYYIADLIWELGSQGADIALLEQLLEIQRANFQAEPSHAKGLRRAYWELLKTCDLRGMQDKMGPLYLQAKAEGVEFSPAFTQKLERLANAPAPVAAAAEAVPAALDVAPATAGAA